MLQAGQAVIGTFSSSSPAHVNGWRIEVRLNIFKVPANHVGALRHALTEKG
jgi:hypothetical protein